MSDGARIEREARQLARVLAQLEVVLTEIEDLRFGLPPWAVQDIGATLAAFGLKVARRTPQATDVASKKEE